MSRRPALTPDEQSAVWDQYLHRVPLSTIAKDFAVGRGTISRTIDRIQRELAADRRQDLEAARAESIAVYHTCQREAFTRIRLCPPTSTAGVGYLSQVIECQKQVDRLLGLEEITVNHRGDHLLRVEEILNRPVLLALPERASA